MNPMMATKVTLTQEAIKSLRMQLEIAKRANDQRKARAEALRASRKPRGPQAPILSERILPYTIRSHLLAYCSRTELLALVTQEEVIEVFRLGGQRAFSVKRKSPQSTVVGIQWIRDGKCLAVALSNGHVDLVSGESGKIVRHGGDDPFSTETSDSQTDRGAITCLGWGTVLTRDAARPGKDSDSKQNDPTTEEWYDRLQERRGNSLFAEDDLELRGQKASLNDLPRQLAFIDVESVLPRLSPIPARHTASGRYDMFATQAALDDYFNSMQRKDRLAADIMFVGHSGGKHRVIIDDILEIGYRPDSDEDPRHTRIPLMYASHPRSKTHALVRGEPNQNIGSKGTGEAAQSYQNLSLNIFDIPLMATGGSHLHLIVSRTAQLRDLCGYISYSIICAKSDWTTHTNLPSRFMENVNETLEEKGEGVLEQNLYHLAMTGHFTPTIHEWLKDELAERGHKRWDHAMTTLYTELSKIFLTNLLPVLERCSVVATNLRGLSRYYANTSKFSVAPETFTDILDALGCLQLLVHEAVQILGQEQRQFRAFSKWLRHQIDLAAADPESVSARDMAEREAANLDYPAVLAYLEGALTNSRLRDVVLDKTGSSEDVGVSVKDVVKAIHSARSSITEASPLLSLHVLSAHLSHVCKAAHYHISKWQHGAGPRTEHFKLETPGSTIFGTALDVRMVNYAPGMFLTYVLGLPHATGEADTCNITLWHVRQEDGETRGNGSQTIFLPPGGKIKTLKFLDDEDLLVVFELDDTHHILRLPYHDSSSPGITVPNDFSDEGFLEEYVFFSFDKKAGFVPKELRVGPRIGKKSVCIIAEDCRQWKILDLEAGINGAGQLRKKEEEDDDDDDDDDEKMGQEEGMVIEWRDVGLEV